MIGPEHNEKGHLIKNVFFNAVPVAHFNADDNEERRLAAIDLVKRGLCNIKTAGEICGFHRNTVGQMIKTKRFFWGWKLLPKKVEDVNRLLNISKKFNHI